MIARKLVAEGKSPALEKQREKRRVSGEHSFGEVGARYFKEARMADSTWSMRKAIFDRDIEPFWKNRRLSEISPDDLRQLCGKVKERGAPATAIHVRDIVKQIFGFAILHGEKVPNPADEVGPASIATFEPKDRALSPAERRSRTKTPDPPGAFTTRQSMSRNDGTCSRSGPISLTHGWRGGSTRPRSILRRWNCSPLSRPHRPGTAQLHVRSRCRSFGRLATLGEPSLHLVQVPRGAARCQVEPAGKLTPLFHFVDRRVGKRDDAVEFRSPHSAFHVASCLPAVAPVMRQRAEHGYRSSRPPSWTFAIERQRAPAEKAYVIVEGLRESVAYKKAGQFSPDRPSQWVV